MQSELDQLVRRLRSLPPRGWSTRREPVIALLDQLAAPRMVPALPDYALADAVAVIGGDAVADAQASADPDRQQAVTSALRDALTATR